MSTVSTSIQRAARTGLAFSLAYSLGLGGIASAQAGTPDPIAGEGVAIPIDPDRETQGLPPPLKQIPAELALPPGPEVARAQSLLMMRRYAEAARLFETLAHDRVPHDPRFLYHAGLARMGADQPGLAAFHLRNFLDQVTLPDALRIEVANRLGDACGQAAAQVHITVSTGDGESTPLAPNALEQHPLVIESTRHGERHRRVIKDPAAHAICLDPGAYDLEIRVPGYYPLNVRRELSAASTPITWQLSLEPQKIVVDLRLSPEKALRRSRRSTLKLTDQSHPGSAQIIREGPTAMTTVVLTPGPWRAEVNTRRYIGDQVFVVSPQTRSLDLPLHKRDADSPRFHKTRKALMTMAVYFPLSYVTGLGFLLGGQAKATKNFDAYKDFLSEAGLDPDLPVDDPEVIAAAEEALPTAEYHQKLRTASALQATGIAFAINGITATVSTLPQFLGSKRRVGYIMLGTGAATVAGGAVWMNFYNNKQDKLLSPTDPAMRVTKAELNDISGHRLGSGMILGAGCGMIIGSALGLLLERRERRRYSATPFGGPGLVSFSLQGVF